MELSGSPRISVSAWPEAEQESIAHVLHLEIQLGNHIEQFEAALGLYDHCSAQEDAQHARLSLVTDGRERIAFIRGLMSSPSKYWPHIALRDSIMTVYHFASTLEGIRKSFKDAPMFRAAVDHEKMRQAGKAFSAGVPQAREARHAVSHSAELTATRAATVQNAASGTFTAGPVVSQGAQNVMLVNVRSGRTLTFTWDNQILTAELSQGTLTTLVTVRELVCEALEPAAIAGSKRWPSTGSVATAGGVPRDPQSGSDPK